MRKEIISQKGAAAVEFALLLLPLILITFGIIEFSVYLYDRQVITNASREGARAGIVSNDPRILYSVIEDTVKNYTQNKLITFGAQNDPAITITPGYNANALFGTDLTVQVSYNYSFLIIPNFLTVPLGAMTATTVMRYE